MGLLMLVALAGYLIAHRINQSAVVGIILAGIVVGPSVFGIIGYTDFVSTLANLGAVVLLFTVGLEFSVKEIAKLRYLVIAAFGVAVPALAGFLLARGFGFDFRASVFVGTALTATSIAITANVLKEMGKLQTSAAKAIIGAAVIDDILALLALSMSEGIVSGGISPPSLLVTALKAIGFIGLGILVGKLVLERLTIVIGQSKLAAKYPETLFLFAIMVAFLYAVTAELVGLSGIVGSFLAGASFAGVRFDNGNHVREGAEHLQMIFASVFFVSLGVIMDLHQMTLGLVWFVIALTAVAVAAKLVGCGVPAYLLRMGRRNAVVVGIGMAPRGEVAMIVALIGLGQNLISQNVYAAVILMSILTTVLPPLFLKRWAATDDSEATAEPQRQ